MTEKTDDIGVVYNPYIQELYLLAEYLFTLFPELEVPSAGEESKDWVPKIEKLIKAIKGLICKIDRGTDEIFSLLKKEHLISESQERYIRRKLEGENGNMGL